MTNILFYILILFLFFSCNGPHSSSSKPIHPQEPTEKYLIPESFIPKVPNKLTEISGLQIYDNLFWGFNDSGGKNELYAFDKSGELKKEIEIKNANNRDWESIAMDKKHIYIGDFGNNLGNREDLCIYKIKKKDIKKAKEQKVEAKKIEFKYSNQDEFKFLNNSTPFDCEAMVEHKGSLYIFSKNWDKYTTTVYKIPTKPGDYNIHPLYTFNVDLLITGADISPDKKQLALVGYKNYESFIWLFTNFSSNNFFESNSCFYKLKGLKNAQTEGISFYGNDKLLVSCEQTTSFPQQVFLFNLKNLNNGTH